MSAATATASDATASGAASLVHHAVGDGADPAAIAAAGGVCVEWLDFDDDERRRLADIVGLEVENETLRAVAERVPRLERRIAELEAGRVDDDVLDLREPRVQHP